MSPQRIEEGRAHARSVALGIAALGIAALACGSPAATAAPAAAVPPATLAWTAGAGATLGAALPLRLGDPQLEQDPHGSALCFDGIDDGLAFEHNPIAGMSEFTIQVLFRPDAVGTAETPSEQRFVHFEEGGATTPESRRALIETRVVGEQWFLDTFLRGKSASKALIDPQKKHPVGHWYWVALSYGDGTLRHYIDAQLELEGAVPFEPLCPGRTSLGVRLNRVSWFKGCLRELRVTPTVLSAAELERMR
jgi:hypothetical protein